MGTFFYAMCWLGLGMIDIGKTHKLQVLEISSQGVRVDARERGPLWLEEKTLPTALVSTCRVGSFLPVFLYFDNDGALLATLRQPLAEVGRFARLKVVATTEIGTFLECGLAKDLFLPFSETTRPLAAGETVAVFVYLDKASRLCASMKLDKYIDETPAHYAAGEMVGLFVASRTDLGYKAMINHRHVGVLYENEVFRPLTIGDQVVGYIKNVRPDGKIDLVLSPPGHKVAGTIGEKILTELKTHGGFLPFHDKTPAEEIYSKFGVSKKKFKMALGGLYKQKAIIIEDAGIRVAPKK